MTAPHVDHGDHAFACVDELLQIDVNFVPDLEPSGERLEDAVEARSGNGIFDRLPLAGIF
jgi:hypothetical protein